MDELLYRQHASLEDVHWWFLGRRRLVRSLIERWVPRGSTLLDVGCGAGGMVAELSSDYDTRGVDAAPAAVEACRARGLTNVILGSATDSATWGPLPVAAVALLDVIEHLEDDAGALQAAATAVGKTGHVFVTVPAYQWLWSEHDVRNHHRRRYTLPNLLNLLQTAGLQPVQYGYFNTVLFPVALVQRTLSRLGLGADPLRLPPPALNRPLARLFSAEGAFIARRKRGFPFGLSIYCVSTTVVP